MNEGWPAEIQNLISSTFADDGKKAYGQIATSVGGVSSVRTVHIHAVFSPIQGIAINSNIQARKWKNLGQNPILSGCYWNIEKQIQICFEGRARLLTEKEDRPFVESMWKTMRDEVRITYLLEDHGDSLESPRIQVDPNTHSKSHGVILVEPSQWDVFFNHATYRLGRRYIYQKTPNGWEKRQVNSLHS